MLELQSMSRDVWGILYLWAISLGVLGSCCVDNDSNICRSPVMFPGGRMYCRRGGCCCCCWVEMIFWLLLDVVAVL